MMRLIDSDDEVITDLLVGTLQLIAEAGGWFSPHARIVAREGQLHLTSEGTSEDSLLRIPREVFVRVDEVIWSTDADRLQVIAVPDDFGDLETEMLYLQVALHNQCGKLPWMSRTHPSLAPDLSDEAIDATRALVPSFRAQRADVRDVLWANRCFRLGLEADATQARVLVPIVDLLNHHTAGASGNWNDNIFTVPASRPFGTDECALNYGMHRDALETAVAYGFVDDSAQIAHSTAVSVEVPGIGEVRVSGHGRASDGSLLPLTSQAHPGLTVLNRLTFNVDGDELLRRHVAAATGWSPEATDLAIDKVREANLALVADMMQECGRLTTSPAAGILEESGRVHSTILGWERSNVRS